MPLKEARDYKLNDKDVETTTQRGSGKGGQHQNKTDSCVRMTHKPTKISVVINGRCQHKNRRQARKILEARVAEILIAKTARRTAASKSRQVDGGGRGNKVRTYNFIDSRVVDHRTGAKTDKIKKVMKGRFDLLK